MDNYEQAYKSARRAVNPESSDSPNDAIQYLAESVSFLIHAIQNDMQQIKSRIEELAHRTGD